MIDIVQYLKNMALVIGTKKADDAINGSVITKQVLDQVQNFTKDQKKTVVIKDGPLKNFFREMYFGLFNSKEELRQDLVEWCSTLKEYPSGQEKRGNQGNFGTNRHQ